MIGALNDALDAFESGDGIGATVIVGSEKAFAVGADLEEMASFAFFGVYKSDHVASIERDAGARDCATAPTRR